MSKLKSNSGPVKGQSSLFSFFKKPPVSGNPPLVSPPKSKDISAKQEETTQDDVSLKVNSSEANALLDKRIEVCMKIYYEDY